MVTLEVSHMRSRSLSSPPTPPAFPQRHRCGDVDADPKQCSMATFFCFQAEDGIRDIGVTGVQTCALPILQRMRADSLENVRGEPAMVRHWVRSAESAELITPRRKRLAMLGLGGSVGTPAAGITAPVVAVTSFDDLEKRGAAVKGKIVLFDVPFTEYEAVRLYRYGGASAAAKHGAVAMLLRSVAS